MVCARQRLTLLLTDATVSAIPPSFQSRSRMPSVDSLCSSSCASAPSASTFYSYSDYGSCLPNSLREFKASSISYHDISCASSASYQPAPRFVELDDNEVEIELPAPYMSSVPAYAPEQHYSAEAMEDVFIPYASYPCQPLPGQEHHLANCHFVDQAEYRPLHPQMDHRAPIFRHHCLCGCAPPSGHLLPCSIWQTAPDPLYHPTSPHRFCTSQFRGRYAPLGPSPSNKKAELYKTELCRSWTDSGYCRYEGKCQFAHGHVEMRPVPPARGGHARAMSIGSMLPLSPEVGSMMQRGLNGKADCPSCSSSWPVDHTVRVSCLRLAEAEQLPVQLISKHQCLCKATSQHTRLIRISKCV